MISAPLYIVAALLLEVLIGWPNWLYRSIRHPVVWMGTLIASLERRFNKQDRTWAWRYAAGCVTSLIVIGTSTLVAWVITWLLPASYPGYAIEILVASSLIASRSLYTHVQDVLKPLASADIVDARNKLARIVGRETQTLDEADIARAALESLSENASDGVIAPVFWGLLFGLPGLVAYKAINTLDSMIGHKTERYHAFGGFAARLDDWVNWAPARLTALLIWSAGGWKCRFNVIARQSKSHRSPNAGWPESAMAFALNVRLSGPRQYSTGPSDEPWLNPQGRDPSSDDLRTALLVYLLSIALCLLLLIIFAWTLLV